MTAHLKQPGYSGHQNESASGAHEDRRLARVVTVDKDKYLVHEGLKEIPAEITGKLMFQAESPLDLPTVGDWVNVQLFDNGTLAIIHEILPRKSLLKRKAAGKKIEFQLIAANVDTALIMQSLDSNFNPRRLERYLVTAREADIDPVVLLSKSDLVSSEQLDELVAMIRTSIPKVQIVAFSNLVDSGLEQIENLLVAGKTYCLLGSSGVGKTTLINNLLGEAIFETQDVRDKDHKGRHTTTRRQLIVLPKGALLIDNPGMRELGNFGVETGIQQTFDEITELTSRCRFNDCSHTKEDGCAVLQALETGEIALERYNNFIKMSRESAHYERSYLERRERDKKFGRMYKSIMKHSVKKPR